MSITTASIARFLIDGVAYQARLFAMPFHVPENGRVRAHAIGRPDMPFSGVHVLAGWFRSTGCTMSGLYSIRESSAPRRRSGTIHLTSRSALCPACLPSWRRKSRWVVAR